MPFLFFTLLGLDLITKRLALEFSKELGLTLVFNKGIAFGLFGKFSWLILLLNILVLAGLYLLRKKFFYPNPVLKTAYSFVMAGGIGNLMDRIYLGNVVDFIKLPFIPYFNFADVFVNIGIFIILYKIITFNENPKL